jgi:hypothetical protein
VELKANAVDSRKSTVPKGQTKNSQFIQAKADEETKTIKENHIQGKPDAP